MEDEVVRIAKKMDKMVQKKNAVSGRVPGQAAAETAAPAHAEPASQGRAARPSGFHVGADNVRREPRSEALAG